MPIRHRWWCKFIPKKDVRMSKHRIGNDTYTKARCAICNTATEVVPRHRADRD